MVDLLIIGAGPGGFEAALEARKNSLDVILVDQGPIGGTCLHVGCIPSKLMHHRSSLMYQWSRLNYLRNTTSPSPIHLTTLWEEVHQVRQTLEADMRHQLEIDNIPFIQGKATILTAHEVEIHGIPYYANRILLATGSKPFRPAIQGIESTKVVDSTSLFQLEKLPSHISILGGGSIGVEWASIFSRLGCKVSLLEAAPTLMTTMDQEIVKRLSIMMKREGIDIRLNTTLSKIEDIQDSLKLVLATGEIITSDILLVATGRVPSLSGLGLESLGVHITKNGITVNQSYQTSVDSIYAIGDVIGGPLLAHKAKFQGKDFIHQLMGVSFPIHWDSLPSVVFATQEVASIGLNETTATQQGLSYTVRKVNYRSNGKAVASNEADGFIKLLVDANNTLLGAHILGSHASDLIHELAIIHALHLPLNSLKGIIHAHPTISELIDSLINGY